MRIGREVDNCIHFELLEESSHSVAVAQIPRKEVEVRQMFNGLKVALRCAVIEDIKTEYRIFRSVYLKEVSNEPASTDQAVLVYLSVSLKLQ